MRIFTNIGNICSCKLIVAAQISGKSVEIVEREFDDKVAPFLTKPRFPVLEDDEGRLIFSANAAARLLLGGSTPGEDAVTAQDEWLEWEASLLQPVVHAVISAFVQNGRIAPDLLASLHKLLSKLEDTASNNPSYILGLSVSVVDVVVWCSIYPLFYPDSTLKDVVGKYKNISQWFDNIFQQDAFSAGIKLLPGGSTWENLKTSFTSQTPTPLPATGVPHQLKPQSSTESSKSSQSTEQDNSVSLASVTSEEIEAATAAWNAGKSKLATPRKRTVPVLPNEGERNFLITSALPYVNNVPHLGNIIGCVLSADTFARYCRLRNYNTLYICGTDEYGTATETKAMEEGLTPQQICDKYNKLHSEIYDWFNISFDYFGRTTTQQQTEIAQDIFWKLNERGYILKDSVDQLQCIHCNRFLADRFVEGTCPFCAFDDARGDQCDKCGKLINAVELKNPRCKICRRTPIVKTSQHLFMDLPKLQPLLERHLDDNLEKGIFTNNTKVITRSWIRDGLKPRCISRDLKWGTPVPLEGYKDKVFYVWYDAPIGYISITANYTTEWEKWWKNPEQVELFNFMAKDNVPFHSVIFPSSLLGTGQPWTIVNNLSATEYLNYEDGKFSKSRGKGVFGNNAQSTTIPADVWRFYLLFLRPESQDSTFSWDDFLLKNNSELLNNLGNFVNRALMFVNNNFGGVVPQMTLENDDKELLALVTRELRLYLENLSNIKLRDGIRNILSISRYGNQYMQANKPWVKVKGTPEEKARAGCVVGVAANVAGLLSVMVQPYMPTVSETIREQLNAPPDSNVLNEVFVAHLETGHKIGKPSPIFQKIDPAYIEELKKRFAGKDSASSQKVAAPLDVKKLTAEISKQGDVVRKLKADKAEKSQIDAEVKKLLDLKKQLASAEGVAPAEKTKQKGKPKGGNPQNATAKSPAAIPSNGFPPVTKVDTIEVEKLTKEVSDQGEVVRQLKSQKAEKSKVDQAVAKLLDLKRQLATAKGMDPEALVGGGSNKKKGKKK